MPIEEVFVRPVIKQVAFEIRYPNLFFLKDLIGQLQLRLMSDFPETALLVQRHLLLAQGEAGKIREAVEKGDTPDEPTQKIWQFKSEKGVTVNVTEKSLSILSEQHKTYSLGQADRFRDIIDLACRPFFELTKIPLVLRAGMRYINWCPVPQKTTAEFSRYYNSSFPLDRYPLEQVTLLEFTAVAERNACQLRTVESLQPEGDGYKFVLDFDAWAERTEPARTLEVADRLHAAIATEFEHVAKPALLEYMRGKSNV